MPVSDSWEKVGLWYDKLVSTEGHYYHKHIVIPNILKRLGNSPIKVLDLACGQGILERSLPDNCTYVGVDISKTLITAAKNQRTHKSSIFKIADVSKPLDSLEKDFDLVTVVLALQNITSPLGVIQNASNHLKKGGRLFLILNHPCFRIPRQSSWEIDEKQNMQYRRIQSYMTPLNIPISINPGKGPSSEKVSAHHYPLSEISSWLSKNDFVIENMDEWISDKVSTGKNAKRENRCRKEFPLFLAIFAKKE